MYKEERDVYTYTYNSLLNLYRYPFIIIESLELDLLRGVTIILFISKTPPWRDPITQTPHFTHFKFAECSFVRNDKLKTFKIWRQTLNKPTVPQKQKKGTSFPSVLFVSIHPLLTPSPFPAPIFFIHNSFCCLRHV